MKRLVTNERVVVDSVISTTWVENKGGIKTITEEVLGVSIGWNFGYTFVPWSNVKYIEVKA